MQKDGLQKRKGDEVGMKDQTETKPKTDNAVDYGKVV